MKDLAYWFLKFSPPSDPPELSVYYDLRILSVSVQTDKVSQYMYDGEAANVVE